jgi:hypothetical protein
MDRVLLWMVVIITISGVLLAGLQLMASYKLAISGRQQFGDSSDLLLQHDKITLKSSVTGLFILVISFAFFIIFVFEVYTIKENKSDSTATSPIDVRGGLGTPPASAAAPLGNAGQNAGTVK